MEGNNTLKAIIIGATSGIGKEVAVRLIKMGWHVCLTGRRLEALEAVQNEYGKDKVSISRMDVTREDSLAVLDAMLDEAGAPDLFFYVSGIGFQNRDLDVGMEIDMVRTNCEGMVRLVAHFMNYVRKHPEIYSKAHKAHVAVVSSVAGTAGLGVAPAYSATKKMQQTYISALAQLSRIENIPADFTDIRPGFVRTPILNPDKKYPMMMTVEQAAEHILRALRKRKRIYIFDWRFKALVAFWRCIPRPLWERLTWVKN